MKKLFLTFFCLTYLIFSYCLSSDFVPPVLVSDEGSKKTVGDLKVVMNDAGASVVVWGTNNQNIYVSTRSTAEGIWSDPVKLSDTAGTDTISVDPQIVMNDSGAAVVTWYTQHNSGSEQIFDVYVSTRSSAGGIWSDPVKLSDTDGTENVSYHPEVVLNNSGAAVVTWFTSGNNQKVYVSTRSTAEASWSDPVKLSDTEDTKHISISPRVAMNDSGAAVVTWFTLGNNRNVYVSTRSTAEGSWSDPEKLSTETTENISGPAPQVVMNDSGAAVVTWYTQDPNRSEELFNIYVSTRSSAEASWSPPVKLAENISGPAPQVVMNDSGAAVVTWVTEDPSGSEELFNIYVSTRSSAEASWSLPVKLAGNVDPESLGLVMNDTGAAVVTWQTFGHNTDVYVSTRLSAEASWSPPVKLSDTETTENISILPQVVMNNSGAAVVTWFTKDTSGSELLFNIYVSTRSSGEGSWSDAVKLSDTESTENVSISPQVVMNDLGAALVTWYKRNASGSEVSIYVSTRSASLGSIMGQKTDNASGDPVSNATVQLLSGTSVIGTTSTNSNGKYSFTGLSPGTYALSVSKTDYIMQIKPVAVSAGRVTKVDFSLVVEAWILYKLSQAKGKTFFQN